MLVVSERTNEKLTYQFEATDNVRTVPGTPLSHEIWLQFLHDETMSARVLTAIARVSERVR